VARTAARALTMYK